MRWEYPTLLCLLGGAAFLFLLSANTVTRLNNQEVYTLYDPWQAALGGPLDRKSYPTWNRLTEVLPWIWMGLFGCLALWHNAQHVLDRAPNIITPILLAETWFLLVDALLQLVTILPDTHPEKQICQTPEAISLSRVSLAFCGDLVSGHITHILLMSFGMNWILDYHQLISKRIFWSVMIPVLLFEGHSLILFDYNYTLDVALALIGPPLFLTHPLFKSSLTYWTYLWE